MRFKNGDSPLLFLPQYSQEQEFVSRTSTRSLLHRPCLGQSIDRDTSKPRARNVPSASAVARGEEDCVTRRLYSTPYTSKTISCFREQQVTHHNDPVLEAQRAT